MGLTLEVPPGYSDLSDSALATPSPTFGLDLLKIYDNAVFGLTRPEIFITPQVNGDTVALPVSPIDGYTYQQSELIYMWGIRSTADQTSGWITGKDSQWYFACEVDQATGKVFMDMWYRRSGSDYQGVHTNDGQLLVYTIAQRQNDTLVMASSPSYSAITGSTVALDKPLTQLLAQSLNDDAKFAVVDHEVFYLGEYTNGENVTLPISPADGYHYSAAECKFQFSWRWTAPGASPMAQPSLNDGQLGPIHASVNSSGLVTTLIYYIDNGGNLISFNDGRIAVFAFCQRSGTPGTITPTANSFAEISFDDFMPGQPLPYRLIQQMIKNTQQAMLSVEFFGPTAYGDGSTIALPTSPIDGYAYSRSELYYLYEWSDTTNQTGTHLRVALFYANVDQLTGNVALVDWRLPPGGPYIDDNNSLCRINVLTVARRFAQPLPPLTTTGVTPQQGYSTTVTDVATTNYQTVEQAGTVKPPEPILNFLDPITATDDSANTSTDIAVPDMLGDTGSGGKHGLVPAPGAGDAAAHKYLKADGTFHVPETAGGPYAITFDMGGGRTTPPGTSESLLRHVIPSNLTQVALPSGLTGSYADCRTAPTGAYSITIKKNGTSIGSINFAASSTTATFTFTSSQTLVTGDLIEFVGGTADPTILGIYFTISGLRS
jgi:hypothetical protein